MRADDQGRPARSSAGSPRARPRLQRPTWLPAPRPLKWRERAQHGEGDRIGLGQAASGTRGGRRCGTPGEAARLRRSSNRKIVATAFISHYRRSSMAHYTLPDLPYDYAALEQLADARDCDALATVNMLVWCLAFNLGGPSITRCSGRTCPPTAGTSRRPAGRGDRRALRILRRVPPPLHRQRTRRAGIRLVGPGVGMTGPASDPGAGV